MYLKMRITAVYISWRVWSKGPGRVEGVRAGGDGRGRWGGYASARVL